MPILWQYLIYDFLKIVCACVLAFVTILLTMQLNEIAHFAALGAPLIYIFRFTLYQIPYILPIALPLSCLIAALLLVQRLSDTHELTAIRASGFALYTVLVPIWLVAAFLSIGNFWMTSELATQSHLQNNLLKSELRSINPLLLLQNKHLMRLKGFYFEALGVSHVGEYSSNIVLAFPNQHHQRIQLMLALRLSALPTIFISEGMTSIIGLKSEKEEDFDQLMIENIKKSTNQVDDFSHVLQKKVWTVNNDYLKMSLLFARIEEQKKSLREAELKEENHHQINSLKHHLNRSLSEIVKRFSIAFAVFSFTLMGTAFGIHIGRQRHSYSLYFIIALTALYLTTFFIAKGMDYDYWFATALYIIPHFIIILISLMILRRASKGIE